MLICRGSTLHLCPQCLLILWSMLGHVWICPTAYCNTLWCCRVWFDLMQRCQVTRATCKHLSCFMTATHCISSTLHKLGWFNRGAWIRDASMLICTHHWSAAFDKNDAFHCCISRIRLLEIKWHSVLNGLFPIVLFLFSFSIKLSYFVATGCCFHLITLSNPMTGRVGCIFICKNEASSGKNYSYRIKILL